MNKIFIISILLLISMIGVSYALDQEIWTDQESYSPGDYIQVHIKLPDQKFFGCNTSLISPNNFIIRKGSGGCVAGTRRYFDSRYMTEPTFSYVESGKLTEFLSSFYINGEIRPQLKEPYGIWTVEVLVNKEKNVPWKTLTTTFKYECYSDSACEDNIAATDDLCTGNPKVCTHEYTTQCKQDDYCPSTCNYPEDIDCDECTTDEECNDDNACTQEQCIAEGPRRCEQITSTPGCSLENNCLPQGTRTATQYCSTTNTWIEQGDTGATCSANHVCIAEYCKDGTCQQPGIFVRLGRFFKSIF